MLVHVASVFVGLWRLCGGSPFLAQATVCPTAQKMCIERLRQALGSPDGVREGSKSKAERVRERERERECERSQLAVLEVYAGEMPPLCNQEAVVGSVAIFPR